MAHSTFFLWCKPRQLGIAERPHVTRGQTVLIHGAAGNVGAYAVQFAHQAGLRVIATVGAGNTAYVRSLGADDVIDFRAERFEDKANAIDAVIDLVDGQIQRRSFSSIGTGMMAVEGFACLTKKPREHCDEGGSGFRTSASFHGYGAF
jgi:NADPH:quinone reductase-like Zn-dependent oxidoreductase